MQGIIRSAATRGGGLTTGARVNALGRRFAHAARLPEAEEEHDHQRPGPSHTSKQRAGPSLRARSVNDAQRRGHEEYIFPKRGSHGGAPDPFEVLGLERTADEGDIKKKCASPPPEG